MHRGVSLLIFPAWRMGWIAFFPAGVCAGIGVFFLLFPVGPNPWGGVRVPWTYADREIWDRSLRLTAWLLIVAGVGFLLWWPLGIAASLGLAAISIPYARALYVRKYGTSKTWHGREGLIDYRPIAKCPNCGHLNRLNSPDDLALARCEQCRYPLERAVE